MSSHNDSFVASGTSPAESDFNVDNLDSIFLLPPLTPAANSWISQHLPEDRMTFGGTAVRAHISIQTKSFVGLNRLAVLARP